MGLRELTEYICELVFPPRCLLCDGIVPIGGGCLRCGDRIEALFKESGALVEKANASRNLDALDSFAVSFIYGDEIAEIVRRFKFDHKRDLAIYMAAFMKRTVRNSFPNERFDFLTCVPSYKDKNDHASVLAKRLARALDMEFKPVLVKGRATEKQHDLPKAKRATNLLGAFSADAEKVEGKRVLLCDDVATSGNTLNECAAVLRASGAAAVFGAAFSATGNSDLNKPSG